MLIGNKEFNTAKETYIMGILNVTPDSFSDGGRYNTVDSALRQTEKMIEEGAAIIDIGGESTRPGYTMISEEEEMARVVPVIEAIKQRYQVPISLDTYKSKVAAAGLDAGADMINDIWGLKYDKDMAKTIASYQAACCLMHNRKEMDYVNFMQDVIKDLTVSVEIAESAGIDDSKIMLDPGIGFAKNLEQNLQAIHHLEELHMFGHPLLLAASRKSVIGLTLDVEKGDRLEGTLATTVLAVMKGCSFVRVHDVKENCRVIKMVKAVLQAQ